MYFPVLVILSRLCKPVKWLISSFYSWIDPDIQGPWHHAPFLVSQSKIKHQLGHLHGQVCLFQAFLTFTKRLIRLRKASICFPSGNLFSRIAGRGDLAGWRRLCYSGWWSLKEKAGLPPSHFHSPGAPLGQTLGAPLGQTPGPWLVRTILPRRCPRSLWLPLGGGPEPRICFISQDVFSCFWL